MAPTGRLQVPQPQPFLQHAGDPPVPFTTWVAAFNSWLTLVEVERGEALNAKTKNALLFSLLGSEGLRQFGSDPVVAQMDDQTPPTHAVFQAAVKQRFHRPASISRACLDFQNRRQGSTESAADFVAALRELAPECQFPATYLDRALAQQILAGCRSTKARERMLLHNPDQAADLTEFIRILDSDEAVQHDSALFAAAAGSSRPSGVHAVQPNTRLRRQGPYKGSKGSGSNTYTKGKCMGCGSGDHRSKDNSCPARNAECRFCHKTGHYENVCISKQKSQAASTAHTGTHTGDGRGLKCITHSLHAVASTALASTPFTTTVHLRDPDGKLHTVVGELDSGSYCSIVSRAVFDGEFRKVPLKCLKGPSYAFGGTPISGLEGSFNVTVLANGRECSADFLIASADITPLFGRDVINGLELSIHGSQTSPLVGPLLTGIDSSCSTLQTISSLSSMQDNQNTYTSLLREFPTLTCDHLGSYPGFQHRILLKPGTIPIACRPRPAPLALREGVEAAVRELDRQGVWEPVEKSEWVLRLVTPVKPTGELRITTDFTPLNKSVVPSRHPLPTPEELFLKTRGSSWFTKLDLVKGYHQIELHLDSRPLTTTATPLGLRQYKRMPLRLTDSGATMQRCIEETLSGLEGVCVYTDDILIYASTKEAHDDVLRKVLRRLHAKDFRIQLRKCVFGKRSMPFLGRIVSAEGLSPDPKNVEAIDKVPPPTNSTELKSFLGMVGFYSIFLPKLADTVEPLRELERKDTPFVWSERRQAAFEEAKASLGAHLKLALFDPRCPTHVNTDASGIGLGATLTQEQGGHEVTVCCASHTLTETERHYSTVEKEALACLWAIEHWEKYLLGRSFTLHTDQHALKQVLGSPTQAENTRKTSKFIRWAERLSAYDFTIAYRPGSENLVPDALSRLPQPSSGPAVDDGFTTRLISQIRPHGISFSEVQECTRQDLDLQAAIRYTENGWPHKAKVPQSLMSFFHVWEELEASDGVLLRSGRLVLPTQLQTKVVRMAHIGHPGMVRMKRKLRDCYWWPGLDTQVETAVRCCPGCQRSGKSQPPDPIPPIAIPKPDVPWKRLGLDLAGPYSTAPQRQQFVASIVDYHSGFPEVFLTTDVRSSAIIRWLKRLFARYGCPEEIVMDNGPQFASAEFQLFLEENGVVPLMASVFNPQENGLVERWNKTLKYGIQAFCSLDRPWEDGILELLSQHRHMPSSPQGPSPATLFFQRPTRLAFEINTNIHADTRTQNGEHSTGSEGEPLPTANSRGSPQASVGVTMAGAKTAPVESVCGQNWGKLRPLFRPGEQVLVKAGPVPKGTSPYRGPYTVEKVLGRYTFVLSDGQRWSARRMKRWYYEPLLQTSGVEYEGSVQGPPVVNERQAEGQQMPRRTTRDTAGKRPERYGFPPSVP